MTLEEIFSAQDTATLITKLKQRSYSLEWGELLADYEPSLHKIVNDHQGRRDKVHSDGTVDKAARIPIGLEKLLTKRMTDFTFAIPVKRTYSGTDTEVRQQIAQAIEAIYQNAHIDTENIKRGIAYYASCEIFTMWYTVQRQNTLYGFPSPFKLKCQTFSPMSGCKLYPLFDEKGEAQRQTPKNEQRKSVEKQ